MAFSAATGAAVQYSAGRYGVTLLPGDATATWHQVRRESASLNVDS
jgi:hypothetical protein